MKELEKTTKGKDMSLETKIIHIVAFPITMYGCESWTVKKAGRGKMIQCILEGFHGRDLMVVVGFLGSLAVF